MQGLLAFQRYFDFKGRSARAEYCQFTAIFVAAVFSAYVIDLAIGGIYRTPTLTTFVVLACLIPDCSVAVRRFHDHGRSGWWIGASVAVSSLYWVVSAAAANARYTAAGDILTIVSYAATLLNLGLTVFLIVQLVHRGDELTNQYGPDPLAEPTSAPRVSETITRAKSIFGTLSESAQVTPTASRQRGEDPLEQIERLATLRDAGVLTEDEFAQQKAALLGRL